MLALELLRYAAGNSSPTSDGQLSSLLREVSDRELRWLLAGGLGPLIFHATRNISDGMPAKLREVLLSADLTAQVLHGAIIDSAKDVIDACAVCEVPVTLLKGISISGQYYPEAHLRPMSDVDVLIPAQGYSAVESELARRGFQRGSDPPMEDAYHGIPLVHRERRVWVELHTALYPQRSGLMENSTFGLQNVAARSVDSLFHGRQVRRLSNELQLVYIASSWIQDLTLSRIHPTSLPALFDAVYLLKSSGENFNWSEINSWLDDELAATSLFVVLSYLARRGLCAPAALSPFRSHQRLVGAIQLPIIHAIVDHYLIGGRPWNLLLPPPVPGRYNLRRQLRKRLWGKF